MEMMSASLQKATSDCSAIYAAKGHPRRGHVDPAYRSRPALAGKTGLRAYLERHRNDLLDYVRSWKSMS